jgi:hypothetical protein
VTDRSIARVCRFALAFTLPALAILLSGCGGGKGDVSGKVTYKGKAVVYGQVGFVGPDGNPRAAKINPDGSYSVTDVAAGEAKITVSSVLAPPKSTSDRPPDPRYEAPESVDPDTAKKWFPIPLDYGDIGKTKLRFTVKRGSNSYDIQLD